MKQKLSVLFVTFMVIAMLVGVPAVASAWDKNTCGKGMKGMDNSYMCKSDMGGMNMMDNMGMHKQKMGGVNIRDINIHINKLNVHVNMYMNKTYKMNMMHKMNKMHKKCNSNKR